MLRWALKFSGPVAIRFPKGDPPNFNIEVKNKIEYGKGEVILEGGDGVIFAIGDMVYPSLEAAKNLKKEKINISIVNLRFIKPLDRNLIINLTKKIKRVIIVENHVDIGGIKDKILNLYQEEGISDIRVEKVNLPNRFIEHGSNHILYEKYGLSVQGIINKVKKLLDKRE
jgi:1-deoxy-D-xylulose-5-phosphate synthase